MQKFFTLFFIFFVGAFICCRKKIDSNRSYSCNESHVIIDTIEDQTGTFTKLDIYDNYAISLHVSNTIDEVKVYILCSAPLNPPNIGKEVTFSGAVRTSSLRSEIVGTEYYELDLTSLK